MAGRERERKREREIFAHMYLEEANGGEREVCCRWAHWFLLLLLLLLLPLSAPGLACSAIKHVTTTTAPTQSLFWCSSKSPDDDDDDHHPRATQEWIKTKQANVHKSVFFFFPFGKLHENHASFLPFFLLYFLLLHVPWTSQEAKNKIKISFLLL